ncbi:MFS transporter [Luteococcus sp. H91]
METSTLSHNRDFTLLLWGRTCQITGGAMTALALMLYTVDLTGSSQWGAVVMAASTIGSLLMSLPAGVLADRWDRRRIMVHTSLLLAVVLASVPAAAAVGVLHPLHLVVASFLVAVLGAFFGPAEQASLSTLVRSEDLAPAASLNQARSAVANLIGPSLAGALYALGHALPLLGDALLNLVSALVVGRIRTPLPAPADGGPPHRPGRDLRDGLRFIVATPPIRVVVGMTAIASFGFGGLLALITLTFKAQGQSDALIGGMQTAYGLAGLAGALAGPWLLRRARTPTLFIGGILTNCACAAAMAVWPQPHAIIALLCLACLTLPPGMAGVQAYQLTITPPELQGRVAGASGFLTLALAPAATLLAGTLASRPWTLAISPFLSAIGLTAVIAIANPHIRTIGVPGRTSE